MVVGKGKSWTILFISFSKKEYASEREPPNMTTLESIAKIKTFKIIPDENQITDIIQGS